MPLRRGAGTISSTEQALGQYGLQYAPKGCGDEPWWLPLTGPVLTVFPIGSFSVSEPPDDKRLDRAPGGPEIAALHLLLGTRRDARAPAVVFDQLLDRVDPYRIQ